MVADHLAKAQIELEKLEHEKRAGYERLWKYAGCPPMPNGDLMEWVRDLGEGTSDKCHNYSPFTAEELRSCQEGADDVQMRFAHIWYRWRTPQANNPYNNTPYYHYNTTHYHDEELRRAYLCRVAPKIYRQVDKTFEAEANRQQAARAAKDREKSLAQRGGTERERNGEKSSKHYNDKKDEINQRRRQNYADRSAG